MGLLDGLGAVSQLKDLLTDENIDYLDKVLTVTLTPGSQAYNALWLDFQKRCGGDPGNKHFTKAAGALTRLHRVVREQRRGGV